MRLVHLVVPIAAAGAALSACGSSSTSTTSSSSSSSSSGPASSSTTSTTSTAAAVTYTCVAGTLTMSGSTALQPLAQKAATSYQQKCAGSTITVSGGGSSTGLANVASGTSDIGMSDVPVSNAPSIDPTSVTDHQVAIVLFAVIVNPASGVTNLTKQQIVDVFSGKDTNWSQAGGANVPITLIERKPGSGTRLSFDKILMGGTPESATPASTQDSTSLVVQGVAGADGGVSYLNVASAGSTVPVSIDGTAPTAANVASGSYPFFAHEHMYTKGAGSPIAQDFVNFMLTPSYQSGDVVAAGFLPISTTTAQSAVDK
jgi:phosphate transport system substrate-binding protein